MDLTESQLRVMAKLGQTVDEAEAIWGDSYSAEQRAFIEANRPSDWHKRRIKWLCSVFPEQAAKLRRKFKPAIENKKTGLDMLLYLRIRGGLGHHFEQNGIRATTLSHRFIEALIGWSIDDLKVHLESKFGNKYTWQNFSQWHIDHIIPKSSMKFKRVTDASFQECWALENLQPLWGPENLEKGNKAAFIYKKQKGES